MSKLLGLRRPGLAIYALAAFAFIALAAWNAYSLQAERTRTLANSRATVATAAIYIGNYIARTVDAADLLSKDVTDYIVDEGGLAAISRADLEALLAERVSETSINDNMLVVDPAGRAVAFSGGGVPAGDFSDRSWFRAHSSGGADLYLGPTVKSRVLDTAVYTFSRALRAPDGTLQGVVAVGVTPTPPQPPSARRVGEPLGQLWTTDGRLIVASHMEFDAGGNPLPQRAPFTTAPTGPAGVIPTGPERMIAYATASGQPLVATVTLGRDEMLAGWRKVVRDSIVLLAVSGIVMALLAFAASRFADQDYRARVQLQGTTQALSVALGEKELLLREIHHRVKNNLQITSNLIRLQARQFKDPEVLAAFQQTQQRLRSISLVHDVLYHENTSARVDLGVYLNELTRELANANGADARGVVVTVEAESVILPPNQVTPLGLCLGEVLTNVFKHAFPEGSGGTIAVEGREVGEEVEVTVRDNGQGFDEANARKGSLGLMLISVLTQQLRGRYSFANENGTVFRLAFPKVDG